ncbi:MAG TPA: alpha-glucosidase C-terminal domain-containing protein, partial [Verrucomicrobiota bacterium]|nr:alpha-glucosidase C-terminal domain-containing protein [Verrucomicrobiota bacterium]
MNYDSPHVQRAMKKVFEFWFDLGVDGFRLDAVPYLYEREGTSCENLPETHDYLKKLRQHLDQKYGDRMLLAEANQWPEDAVTYFGSGRGDECHMAFHFPLMPRLFMALRMEDRVPIVDILEQTPPVPETGQWALFLRNHDELTLEMVTDEERDYMYRVYASHSKARLNLGIRRRLAPLLNNDRKRIELLNMLLLSLPGTPVLYYGDEIGMGDNIFLGDRNGVRTPMQWSADKNAGFSRCSPQALYAPIILDPEYHYEAVNVETQQRNPHALLWWTKRVLALRKRWKVFGLGTFQFLHPANRKVLAYIRRHENEKVLVLANLSRFPQPVELDLSAFQGERLIELFGRTKFPVIGPGPYTFTLSPHAAFWFSIEPVRDAVELTTPARTTLAVDGDWNEILAPHMRANLEAALPAYIAAQRWFATRTSIKSARIIADVAMPVDSDKVALAIIVTELVEHEPEQYLVPIAFASGPAAAEIELHSPGAVIARLHSGEAGEGILYDATASPAFWEALLELLGRRRTIRGDEGELESLPAAGPRPGRDEGGEPVRLRNDDRNASMSFGERFIIKLLRKVEPGVHPELEAARFLAARAFPHVPPFAGVLEYKSESGDSTCLALLSQFIPNAKNGWTFTLDALKRYFDRIRTLPEETLAALPLGGSLLDRTQTELPEALADLLGTYYESVQLLGR